MLQMLNHSGKQSNQGFEEVHSAPISKEDINHKFLRSLPPSWNQIALIMGNKPDIDKIDIDDLYNNHRVYEDEMKRSSSSTSNSQNLAFLSSENTNSTNEVSTASGDIGVSTAGGTSQVPSTPCAHDIDGDDLEELDLRWQVAMLTVRVKKKGHFARECRSGRNQGRRSYGDNGRSNAPTNESSSQALVAQDGLGGYDWSNDFEVEPVNYALMAISSSSSSSSSDSEIALESLESRILGHEKNELAWGKKYEFQNYELKCREIKINNLNLELDKVVKERDELKDKIAKWEESTKNLGEILNSEMSARDKTGLGYGTQLNEMSNNSETDSEISLSVFDVRSSNEENTPENDRFLKNGYKAVPPSITGNFLTPRADISFIGLDEYAIKNKIIESQTTELNTKTSETAGKTDNANTEKPKSANEPVSTARPVSIVRPSVSTARPSVSTARPICTARPISTTRPSVSTARPVCTARPSVSTARPVCTARPSVSTARPVQNMTTAGTRGVVNTGKGKLYTDFKKSRWVWRTKGNYLDHVSKDNGPFMLKKIEAI
ncbi:hypothetical protein Tco_1368706 [Tanacetum coccineum]